MGEYEVIPSARRLINSLRDLGYDFVQAVADIVDNSIEASASHVSIDLDFDGGNSWVRIADDGRGMKPDKLREALRFGADRDYDGDDLGKFGLGLKTASLSQCQRLSVASRWNPDRADVSAYAWDLDHIKRKDKWEIVEMTRDGLGPSLRDCLKDGPGTVVLWHRLDRLLGYKFPHGEAARKRLQEMCRDLELHLGMVFERFLSGKIRGKKLKIALNGNVIAPWDPFCRNEAKTRTLHAIELPLVHEGVSGIVIVEPYVLPHQDDFSSRLAFDRASGPGSWNQQQGFYVYRANRMIQSGGWSNLRAPDEHTKLARVAVSFSPALDEAFKVNVAKMRVQMPAAIREEVKSAMTVVVRMAREVYDRKGGGSRTPTPSPQARSTNVGRDSAAPAAISSSSGASLTSGGSNQRLATGSGQPPTGPGLTPRVFTHEEWTAKLLSVAVDNERSIVERVAKRLGARIHRTAGEE